MPEEKQYYMDVVLRRGTLFPGEGVVVLVLSFLFLGSSFDLYFACLVVQLDTVPSLDGGSYTATAALTLNEGTPFPKVPFCYHGERCRHSSWISTGTYLGTILLQSPSHGSRSLLMLASYWHSRTLLCRNHMDRTLCKTLLAAALFSYNPFEPLFFASYVKAFSRVASYSLSYDI